MALIPTERSICNKVVADFEGLTSPIRAAKGQIRSAASDFADQLRNTVWSEQSVLDQALTDFEDDLEEILPGDTSDDVQAIKDMIDNCDYLSSLSSVSTIAGTAGGIYDGIEDIINSLSETTPEFQLGGIADTINNILKGIQFPFGDDISALFAKADKLIECLAAYCGGEYPSQVTQFTDDLNQLYSDMNIVSDPNNENYTNFDYGRVYSEVGLNPTQISNVTSTINKIDEGNQVAKSAIDSSIEAIKDTIKLPKIGGI